MKMTGGCLCGAVRFEAGDVPEEMGICHCGQCRRWASGPYFAVRGNDVSFEGEENLGRYRSSDWAERGFCKLCGSSLFYHMHEEPFYMLAVGAFDDQSRFTLKRQVFIDEKPAFYAFAGETENSSGDDFFVGRSKRVGK